MVKTWTEELVFPHHENMTDRYQDGSLGMLTPSSGQPSSTFNPDTKLRMPASLKDIDALREKAKESIAAKRGNSVRSTSQESKPSNAENPNAKFMKANPRIKTPLQENSSGTTRKDFEDSTKTTAPVPSTSNGVSRIATSTDIDDLLAEGRAAASNGQLLSESAPTSGVATTANFDSVMRDATIERVETGSVTQTMAGSNGPNVKLENVSPQEADDIQYWLKMTGYHDQEYRNKMLSRRRRLKEIEDEREKLLREEQEENPFRSPFRARTEEAKPIKTDVPAPELAVQSAQPEMGMRIKSLATKPEPSVPLTSRSDESSLKRRNDNFMDVERSQPHKLTRADSTRAGPGPSFRNGRSRSPVRREPEIRNRNYQSERRGSGEQRAAVLRRDEPLAYREPPTHHRPDTGSSRSGPRHPHNNITRFFMLKSWTLENIEMAQKEGTWATQTKNEAMLVEAFKTCKNVVFFFSANHSKAFQGYARMESLPGDRNAAEPSWVRRLHWPTTEAFRLKWIRMGDTPYWMVGNLKNPLNEDMNVFVARDGQEIPEDVGHALCDIIDDNLDHRAGHRRQ